VCAGGWLCLVSLSIGLSSSFASAQDSGKVDFSRDIQPVLSQYCYACHGPDEGSREAGLRLDRGDAALAALESGDHAILPGDTEGSTLVARITSTDPSLRMPPGESGQALTEAQIRTLTQWIKEGAKFDSHWSFRPVAAVAVPDGTLPPVSGALPPQNPIDEFIQSRLAVEGLLPNPEADRATLLRRLSLDLLGIPPTPDELQAFLNDPAPDAYERLVDRLLASPQFGERWGRHWLDLAHYADSEGYLGDTYRPYAWLYRDWVIDAHNRDLPFDEFTIQQLAGDLLSDATLEQKIATGFLRNTLRNTEAGVDLEEYRLKEIVDRISTIGVGWLGLSVGCAECHSHKFDPISHREFYELFAFFNNADDVDVPALQPGEGDRYQNSLQNWKNRESVLKSSLQHRLQEVDSPLKEDDPKSVLAALATEARRRKDDQKKLVEVLKESSDEELQKLATEYERLIPAKPKPPATKAMTVSRRETERVSYIHLRGDYRSKGDDVRPGTPAVLPKLEVRGEQADRLDLARWLVSESNPLTSRVTVNRYWQHLFGRGIVSTADNFGSGGETPSHPELLDWLAQQQIQRGWSRKAMLRLIVTSATYRQASYHRPELEERDPLNVLLARQQRLRLEAEVIRDAALEVSGLLNPKIGGEGVRPPQPAYVASISRNVGWETSKGADLYRRGMYIVFRRATPYPMLLTFDAPDSTVACVRRERSNSPLQALTLLNDPVFFECAQAFGSKLAHLNESSLPGQLALALQSSLGRLPRSGEVERLQQFYEDRYAIFRQDTESARAVLQPLEHQGKVTSDPQNMASSGSAEETARLAAWTLTARVLLNLDEFITRE